MSIMTLEEWDFSIKKYKKQLINMYLKVNLRTTVMNIGILRKHLPDEGKKVRQKGCCQQNIKRKNL